jgi:sucrose phosphorylase
MNADSMPAAEPTDQNAFLGSHYLLEPDFSRPRLKIEDEKAATMQSRLKLLYGEKAVREVYDELERILAVHYAYMPEELEKAEKEFDIKERFTGRDVVLITYGDLFVSEGQRPLQTLAEFAEKIFGGLITTLHILPFYPYSSDRGFSVINYGEVDPHLGTWEDIAEIGDSFKLMFDGVINHCSAKCKWFRRFLSGDPDYDDYFIAYDSPDAIDEDSMKKILRPRTSNLLSPFETIDGTKYVWTTFSTDQVDLNFKNPRVMCKIVRILLDYVRRGADIIRLDAITYLWTELGTSCAHLEQTHEVAKLLRDILDVAAPHVAIITETNVPHADNITYFGDGTDEGQMVYNFALPPLVLHTFMTGSAVALSGWAKELVPPTETTAFFNFLDSHDGIGVLGAKGYISDDEIAVICKTIEDRGGFVSMKDNGDGTQSPYELNTTWFSALNPEDSDEPRQIQIDRFLASRAIALVLRGVPGIYMHSLFASKNDLDAVTRDGVRRSINRAALEEEKIISMFMDRSSIEHQIHACYMDLLELRVNDAAFHPNAPQEVLDLGSDVFALKRCSQDGTSNVLSVINVTDREITLEIPKEHIGSDEAEDVVARRTYEVSGGLKCQLRPYQVAWFKAR